MEKWPDCKDECVYSLEAIVSKINPPVVATHQGQFSLIDRILRIL